jgi:hypothetical protein
VPADCKLRLSAWMVLVLCSIAIVLYACLCGMGAQPLASEVSVVLMKTGYVHRSRSDLVDSDPAPGTPACDMIVFVSRIRFSCCVSRTMTGYAVPISVCRSFWPSLCTHYTRDFVVDDFDPTDGMLASLFCL